MDVDTDRPTPTTAATRTSISSRRRRWRPDEHPHRGRASDASVITKRNLIKIKRVPDLVVWTTMMPIMFVLLFAYVFGGAIDVPASATGSS